ncbi:DUF3558 domain-containing protein [Rhodococcus sp. AG1013]|uniref:DUF3558 domain-containing protein n=1 Tax=Rhodococcus sp. AG1013 TaxID=2183996 RepID=UPI00215DA5DA|nr:DUF3558 domain-containing protein [Rhodococcus sp. AG1013]
MGLIGAGLALAGCGSGTVSGTADPEAVASGEPAFSPCDDIPDDTLRAVGVDPATEGQDIYDVKQPGWNICMWRGPAFHVTVLATTYTLDDVRSNANNEEFAEVDVEGRPGVLYRQVSDRNRERCDVALSSDGGAVIVQAGFYGKTKPRDQQEPCEVATRAAGTIASHVPA